MIKIKFAIIFKKDGLNEESVKNSIADCGVKVTEIDNDDYIDFENNTSEPVRIFYCDGNIDGYLKTKIKFNCLSDPEQQFVLWPIAV